MKAKIVVDLCFGDSGKGITTDYLCTKDNNNKVVVRFSGGQQAGHNVVIGDISHIFSNFGSGTLRGVPSYFSEYCTMYPLTTWREKQTLHSKNHFPTIIYHPNTMVTTPFDVVYNRMTEQKLGHGSCGLGIAATMKRNQNTGHKLYVIDLVNRALLTQKLKEIYKYYLNQFEDVADQMLFDNLSSRELEDFMTSLDRQAFQVETYQWLTRFYEIIFEGSQGILLDMDYGIFPNVTYGNTTSKNAMEICEQLRIKDIEMFYVTRCYQTRHGAGWMSNETPISLVNNDKEINVFNEWQKNFRIGELDYDLLNYSLQVDRTYSNNIAKNLVVTCIDQRPDFKFNLLALQTRFEDLYYSFSPDSKDMVRQLTAGLYY